MRYLQTGPEVAAQLKMLEERAFRPLMEVREEVLRRLVENPYRLCEHDIPSILLVPDNELYEVQEHLAQKGVRNVAYAGHGTDALAVRFNDAEIGRIVSSREPRRLKLPIFLEPTYGHEFPTIRLEVLPELNSKSVMPLHYKALEEKLREYGFVANDLQGNVGLTKNRTPLIWDPRIIKKRVGLLASYMRHLHVTPRDMHSASELYDFAEAQRLHRDALGLRMGEIGIHEPAGEKWAGRNLKGLSGDMQL